MSSGRKVVKRILVVHTEREIDVVGAQLGSALSPVRSDAVVGRGVIGRDALRAHEGVVEKTRLRGFFNFHCRSVGVRPPKRRTGV
jgi:hypothetical protein